MIVDTFFASLSVHAFSKYLLRICCCQPQFQVLQINYGQSEGDECGLGVLYAIGKDRGSCLNQTLFVIFYQITVTVSGFRFIGAYLFFINLLHSFSFDSLLLRDVGNP